MEGTYEDVRVEKQNEKNGAFVCLIKFKNTFYSSVDEGN
jgi:hypothetical protein